MEMLIVNEPRVDTKIAQVTPVRPVAGENFLTTGDILDRYDITKKTLQSWRRLRGFPEPVRLVQKNYYSFPEVRKWEVCQAGRDVNAEFALGMRVVSGAVIQTYAEFLKAMKERKADLGLTNTELETLAGMAEGHIAKLEAYPKGENSRGMGPDTFPLWIGGLRVGVVLVEIPRRPKRGPRMPKKPGTKPVPKKDKVRA